MSDSEIANHSLLSYEINGTQFIIQALGSTPDTIVTLNEDEDGENTITFVEQTADDKEDVESIPLVCLDGQVYAIRNGVLQALDISQLEYEAEVGSPEGKAFVLDEQPEENEADSVEITRYVSDSDASLAQEDEGEELETAPNDDKRLFIVAKDDVNADDFVEVVTAFKCKICPYTTQDREQLVKHFGNVHANPAAKVS